MIMASLRDYLRMGRAARNEEREHVVKSPEVVRVWGRCPRSLHMPVATEYTVIESGRFTLQWFSMV